MLSLIDLSAIEVLNHCIGFIFKPETEQCLLFAGVQQLSGRYISLYTILMNFIQHQTTYYCHT